ncbi:hypothetical protein M407DRAFT_34478 [Tulasnella calospora MUT 4182]|uniref:Uncharacterized protein n=1 Tax=Tulasnella calospora MUT 4182 TaxID=1051891 RepID=A0A0C3K3D4_9AGAM|nr:hypothetical protein M407DRAFT_34478 [Tulasnella calospora MUT 4182]
MSIVHFDVFLLKTKNPPPNPPLTASISITTYGLQVGYHLPLPASKTAIVHVFGW